MEIIGPKALSNLGTPVAKAGEQREEERLLLLPLTGWVPLPESPTFSGFSLTKTFHLRTGCIWTIKKTFSRPRERSVKMETENLTEMDILT